jgi:long-chain fatty acid transport protein
MKTLSNTLLATAVATLFMAPTAFATNGTNMTGVSAPSATLGGTGVAIFLGPSNAIINPAMIGKSQGSALGVNLTLFKPSVSNDGGDPAASKNSSADTFYIPSFAYTSRINKNLTWGIGAYGTSGMGVDYKNSGNDNLFNAQTNLAIMRIVPTIAYNSDNYGVGFSPIIQYGSLDINYQMPAGFGGAVTDAGNPSTDFGYGFTLGGFYDVNKQFTLGAAYTSAINMKYGKQLSTASAPFVGFFQLPAAFGDELEQPAEIKVGAAYNFGAFTLTGDLKQVRWGDAKGYKDFGWENQNVIALGLKYQGTGYWLGAGYNKGDNPIKAKTDANAASSGTINMFNNIFFPAVTESHFSVGGGYDINKSMSLQGAVVYAPEVSASVKTNNMLAGPAGNLQVTNTTKHSQMQYSVALSYKF